MANLFELTARLLEIKAQEVKIPAEQKRKQVMAIDKNGQYVVTRHGKTGLFDADYKVFFDPIPPAA